MQLDRTRIAIRERNATEILDLGLRVLQIYFTKIVLLSGAFILPVALLNEFLLAHFVADELTEYTIPQYITAMAQLVYLQAPFVTAGLTLFLGGMMFLQEPDLRTIIADLKKMLLKLTWVQLLTRGVVLGIVIAVFAWEETNTIHFLWMVVAIAGVIRLARPYINEIILLEKNPLRAKNKNSITIGRRSSRLHGPSSAEIINRAIVTIPVFLALTVSIVFSFWFLQGLLTNVWAWGHVMTRVFVPLSLWLVAIYATIIRFLNYLDLRIRREGWEVELRVRAAASEMQGIET